MCTIACLLAILSTMYDYLRTLELLGLFLVQCTQMWNIITTCVCVSVLILSQQSTLILPIADNQVIYQKTVILNKEKKWMFASKLGICVTCVHSVLFSSTLLHSFAMYMCVCVYVCVSVFPFFFHYLKPYGYFYVCILFLNDHVQTYLLNHFDERPET